jgi:hypothetical protein
VSICQQQISGCCAARQSAVALKTG